MFPTTTSPALLRFFRNVALVLGTDLALGALTFALNVWIIRQIGPEQNGAVNVVVGIANALTIPMLLGLHAASTQAIAAGTPAGPVVGTVFSVLALAIPASMAAAAASSTLAAPWLGVAPSMIWWAAAFGGLQALQYAVVGVLNGLQQFAFVARANVVSTIAYAVVLGLMLAGRVTLGFELLVAASMLRLAVFGLMAVPSIRAHAERGTRETAGRLLTFGGYYAASAVAYTLAQGSIDTLMLNASHGAAIVGLYAAYYLPFNLVGSRALKVFSDVWLPTMAARGDAAHQAPRVLRALVVWGAPLVPLSMLITRVLFLLLGDRYQFDWTSAAMVGLCLHLHVSVTVFSHLQLSSGVSGARAGLVAAIVTAALNVAINALFIPRFAILGCLLATALSSAVGLWMRIAWFSRVRPSGSADTPKGAAISE